MNDPISFTKDLWSTALFWAPVSIAVGVVFGIIRGIVDYYCDPENNDEKPIKTSTLGLNDKDEI